MSDQSATPRTPSGYETAMKLGNEVDQFRRELAEALKKADDADTNKLRAIGLYESCAADREALQEALAEARRQSVSHDDWYAMCNRAEAAERRAAELERDARRWNALLNCKRIRVLGYAGYNEDQGNYRHIGLELWTQHQAKTIDGAKELITQFADTAAALSAQPQQEPVGDTGNPEADSVINRLMSDDPDFDDCVNAAVLIRKLVAEHRGPDGFATWKDAAIAERLKRAAPPSGVREGMLMAAEICKEWEAKLSQGAGYAIRTAREAITRAAEQVNAEEKKNGKV